MNWGEGIKPMSFCCYRRFRLGLQAAAVVLALTFTGLPVWADSEEPPLVGPVYSSNPVVATVEDHPIYLNDLRNAPIHDLMVELHRMQKTLLKEKALEYLVREHPEMKVGEVEEVRREDIVRFYQTTAEVKTMGTLDQMEGNIRNYLEGMNQADYLTRVDKQFRLAVEKGYIHDYFEPPHDYELVAGIGTAMRWFPDDGEQKRKIFFLEFSDFQCPFCKRVQPTLRKLRKKYAQDVQFGYRHFPLPFHKEASRLAEAVECAREQDRFWEVQWLFFQNSDSIHEPEQVLKTAQRAGVKDMTRFEECLAGGKYRKQVQQDIEDGKQIGINGTPTFIIGLYDSRRETVSGEMFSGAVSEEKFIEVIDKYLAEESKLAGAPCLNC